MPAMAIIDRFVTELRRSGDDQVVLLSDNEPRVVGKEGERILDEKVSHKDVTALIEEIVPPKKFADLVMMEPVDFEYTHRAGVLLVRVVPGPSIWRVTLKPKDPPLAPLSEEEERQADEQDPDEDEKSPTSKRSWKELEQIVGPGDGEDDADDADDADGEGDGDGDESDDERARGDAADPGADSEPGEPPEDAELGVLVPPADPAPVKPDRDAAAAVDDPVEIGQEDEAEKQSKPESRQSGRISLDGALARPTGTGEFHVQVEDADDTNERLATGQTVQLSPGELAGLDASGERGTPDMYATKRVPRPPPLVGDAPTAPAFSPQAAAVQPLDIDFRDDEAPSHPIDRLDTLLDRAWSAGATSVLLKDGRTPAMALAGPVEPLPGASLDDGRLVHEVLDVAASPSHGEQLDIEGFCRFVYKPGGRGTLVRCTMVRDRGTLAAWLRRIGDEHLPAKASQWLPVSVRHLMPESGLVLVAGSAGQGKTTTATALAALCHQAMDQSLVVADPLERRLPDEGVGVLQRQIPEDVPSAGRALGDALRLEARLVLVDIPRPETMAVELLALAGQGRLVIATWTAPTSVSAVEALMDALPPSLSNVERARRTRNLRSVVGVKLVPARDKGVVPIFETLQLNQVVLTAVTEARLGQHAGAGDRDLVTLSFDASIAALKSRGLI